MAASLDTRLSLRARALAQVYAGGQLSVDQLRAQMRQAIAEAQTVALLAGTDGQRNAEINTALREIIEAEYAELERLIVLLERQPDIDLAQRLAAFTGTLEETRREGQRLIEEDRLSPLVPLAVGGALGALLSRIGGGEASTRQPLPRIDSRQLRALRDLLGARIDALADDLANGVISLDDWHAAMQRELQVAHSTYARLGGGTVSNERVRRQFEFLGNWRNQLSSQETLSADGIKLRARMYLDNAQASLQEAATARIGIPVLPAYPKDGSSICRTNDRCFWDIRQLDGSGNFDCHWKLRPAENCPTCVTRAATWNPIRVRNGILQPFNTIGVFA